MSDGQLQNFLKTKLESTGEVFNPSVTKAEQE